MENFLVNSTNKIFITYDLLVHFTWVVTKIIRAICPVWKFPNMVQALYKYIPKSKLIEIFTTMGQAYMVKTT